MNTRIVCLGGVAMMVLVMGAPKPASAQMPGPMEINQVRTVVANTGQLLAAGKNDEALQLARTTAGQTWRDRNAMALTHFNLAWAASRVSQSANAGEQRQRLLEEAVKHYTVYLEVHPADGAATENLASVLLRLQSYDRARAVLDKLISATSDPTERFRAFLALGDLAVDQDQMPAAWKSYRAAEEIMPDDARAPQRQVQLYRLDSARDGKAFLDACQRFESAGLKNVAADGYGELVHQGGEWPTVADEALVHWTDLMAQLDALSPTTIGRIVPDGVARDDQTLHGVEWLVTRPLESNLGHVGWWRESSSRRHVIATAMQALAARARREADAAKEKLPALRAAENLLAMARDIAPDPEAYENDPALHGRTPAGLDAALGLASLYSAHRDLDEDDTKFRQLEEQLIDDKTMAYWEDNIPVMLDYHTVLSLIYSDPHRPRWREDSIHDAPYHIEQAVKFAQQLAGRDAAEYKPMPHLLLLYAEGIADQPNRAGKALDLFRDATEGFLDTNNLSGAASALQGLQKVEKQHDLPVQDRDTTLRQLFDIRLGAQRTAGASVDQANAFLGRLDAYSSTLDPHFLQRQKARTLIDLTTRACELGQTEAATELRNDTANVITERAGATRVEVAAFEQVSARVDRVVAAGAPAAAVAPARPPETVTPPVVPPAAVATQPAGEAVRLIDTETLRRIVRPKGTMRATATPATP